MSVSRTRTKGLMLVVMCATALVGAGMSTAATPKKPHLPTAARRRSASPSIVFGTDMYFVNDLSVRSDDAQEALMREVVAKLRHLQVTRG